MVTALKNTPDINLKEKSDFSLRHNPFLGFEKNKSLISCLRI